MITDKATASSDESGELTDGISGTDSDVENPEDLSDDFETDGEYEGLTFDEAYEYCSSLGVAFLKKKLVEKSRVDHTAWWYNCESIAKIV